MKRVCAIAIMFSAVFSNVVLYDVSAAADISENSAIRIAQDFLRSQNYAARYHIDSPMVYPNGEEWYIQFNDKRKHVRPGVCIISVHKTTGAVRLVPVE